MQKQNGTVYADAVLVRRAAGRIYEYLTRAMEGRAWRSVMQWRIVCALHGLETGPVTVCPAAFTADLRYLEEEDLWLAGYNARANDRQIVRYLIHEFAEYLTMQDVVCFDGLPQIARRDEPGNRIYFYNGTGDPGDLRHRIAQQVERLAAAEEDMTHPQRRADVPSLLTSEIIALFQAQVGLMDKQVDALNRHTDLMDRQVDVIEGEVPIDTEGAMDGGSVMEVDGMNSDLPSPPK